MTIATQKYSILVVDDSKDNLQLISGILRDEYIVMAALNGKAALRAAQSEKKPDLILLDVMMPEMNGYEVCLSLKRDPNTKEIPVIFLTSKSEVSDETKSFECGATDFISKPINPPVLKARVKAHLEHKLRKDFLGTMYKRVSRYVSPQIVELLFDEKDQAKIKTQRKKLTIFFSDLCNFTLTCDGMEPEDFTYFINTYLERMSQIALKYGGTVDKFIGDCVMIFFGDPQTKGVKEDAVMCLKMAVEMQEAIKELQKQLYEQGIDKPLSARIGIHTGYVNVGNFGYKNRMDYTLLGRNVNLTSRLESTGRPGKIHISNETYLLVKDVFECKALDEPMLFKGFERPIQTYIVERKIENVENEKKLQSKIKAP